MKVIILGLFHFMNLLQLLLIKSEKFLNKQFQNEISLKIKGPGNKNIFCKENQNGYIFNEYPSTIILNNAIYNKNISNIIELEQENNNIIIKWESLPSSFAYMFYDCESILEVDLSRLNPSNIKNFVYMFSNCESLTSVKLFDLKFKYINVNMNYIFNNCISLNSISNFNIKFTGSYDTLDMNYIFFGCISLYSLSNFTIEINGAYNNLNFNYIFFDCFSLKYIYNLIISIPGAYNTLNSKYIFKECTSLISLDTFQIKDIGAYNNIYLSYIFTNCSSLTSVNLDFRVNAYGDLYMNNIFVNCTSLNSIYFSNILSGSYSTVEMKKIISECNSLKYTDFKNFKDPLNFNFNSFFDGVPKNIAFCINTGSKLFDILSSKGCLTYDCVDDISKIENNELFCQSDCTNYLLYNYNNFCYKICPKGKYGNNTDYKCKDSKKEHLVIITNVKIVIFLANLANKMVLIMSIIA